MPGALRNTHMPFGNLPTQPREQRHGERGVHRPAPAGAKVGQGPGADGGGPDLEGEDLAEDEPRDGAEADLVAAHERPVQQHSSGREGDGCQSGIPPPASTLQIRRMDTEMCNTAGAFYPEGGFLPSRSRPVGKRNK